MKPERVYETKNMQYFSFYEFLFISMAMRRRDHHYCYIARKNSSNINCSHMQTGPVVSMLPQLLLDLDQEVCDKFCTGSYHLYENHYKYRVCLKSKVLIAGCWASMLHFGFDGYVKATKKIIETTRYIENK